MSQDRESVSGAREIHKVSCMSFCVSATYKDHIRKLEQYSYRIIYEIKTDNVIEILAVIHKRQNFIADDLP